MFKAAKAAGKLAIGVDSDQYNLPALADVKDVIMTSMVKRVDVAVYDFVTSVGDGKSQAGSKVYDLKAGGVEYATSGGKIDDIKPKLERLQGEDRRRARSRFRPRSSAEQRPTETGPGHPRPGPCPLSTRMRSVVNPRASHQAAADGVTAPLAVELSGITKRFPGVVANADINITVRSGTVHALVGENGAGKSTLMKILYGMQRPDEGTIAIDGSAGRPSTPRPTRSRRASAWCTSTSCWPTT